MTLARAAQVEVQPHKMRPTRTETIIRGKRTQPHQAQHQTQYLHAIIFLDPIPLSNNVPFQILRPRIGAEAEVNHRNRDRGATAAMSAKKPAIPTKMPADQIHQICKSMPVRRNQGHAVHPAIRTDLAVPPENRALAVEVAPQSHVPDRVVAPKSHRHAVEVAPGIRAGRAADRENPVLVRAAEADRSTPNAVARKNRASAAEAIPHRVRMWVLRSENALL